MALDKKIPELTEMTHRPAYDDLFVLAEDLGNGLFQNKKVKYGFLVPSGVVLQTTDQTVDGIKTFTSFPVLPSGVPVGFQAATADYVDSKVGTGGGTSITSLAFRIPIMNDDSSLQFALELFTTADYSGTAIEAFNTATSQTNVSVSDGTSWVAFPAEGVGTPYYTNRLSIALQNIESNIQYYIRFKFFVTGTNSSTIPWECSQYPILDVEYYTSDKTGLIKALAFRIPSVPGDLAMHFAVEVFETADYTGNAVESYDTETSTSNIQVCDGSAWVTFPSEGVGTPYYENKLAVHLLSVVIGKQYYIRFKFYFKNTTPSDTPWEYSQYPILEISKYVVDKIGTGGDTRWAFTDECSRLSDSTLACADTAANQARFKVGIPMRYADTEGTWNYGIITSYSSGTVSIAGAPIDTAHDSIFYCGSPDIVEQLDFFIGGIYGDVAQDLLLNKMNTYFTWGMSKAYLVRFHAVHKTVDDGTEAFINMKINTALVSTDNTNDGIQLSTTGTKVYNTAIGINTTNYIVTNGDSIEVACTVVGGGTTHAEDLTVSCIFIKE